MTNEGHWPIPDSIVCELPLPTTDFSHEVRGAKVPFSGSRFAVDWLRQVVEVHQRDQIAEHKKRLYKRLGIGLAVVGAILFFIGLSAEWTLGFLLVAVIALIVVFCFVRRRKYHAQDVENHRLEAFSGLVRTLAPDLHDKKPIEASVDFTSFKSHPARASKGEAYCQRWLHVSLPLRDGSYADIAVTLSVKQKSKRKRKYTKIKQRQVESICMRLTPPQGKAFHLNSPVAQFRGRVMSGMLLKDVNIQQRAARFEWVLPYGFAFYGSVGWSTPGLYRVGSAQLVAALVTSYQLAAAGERHVA